MIGGIILWNINIMYGERGKDWRDYNVERLEIIMGKEL